MNNKRILILWMCMALTGHLAIGNENTWTGGQFGGGKSKIVVTPEANGSASLQYQYSSADAKPVYVQSPIQATANFATLCVPLQADKGTYKLNVWAETDKWNFLQQLTVNEGDKEPFTIPLTLVEAKNIKYIRLLIPLKSNPEEGVLKLGQPVVKDKLKIDSASDGLEAVCGWYPVIWQDRDGKKRGRLKLRRQNAAKADGGCVLNVEYQFPDPKCTQIETRLPIKKDCEDKELVVYLRGDGSTNLIEIWCSNKSGKNFFLTKYANKSANQAKLGPIDLPEEAGFVNELKIIIVKTKPGQGTVVFERIKIE